MVKKNGKNGRNFKTLTLNCNSWEMQVDFERTINRVLECVGPQHVNQIKIVFSKVMAKLTRLSQIEQNYKRYKYNLKKQYRDKFVQMNTFTLQQCRHFLDTSALTLHGSLIWFIPS